MSQKRKLKEINNTLSNIDDKLKEESREVFANSLRNLKIGFERVKAEIAQQIGRKK